MIGFLDFPLIPVISWIGDASSLESDTQFLLILLVSIVVGGGLYSGAVLLVSRCLFERPSKEVADKADKESAG
jgi:hypothetical protein